MALRDRFPADAAVMISVDEFAEPVTYTPQGGAPISTLAVIKRNEIDAEEQDRQRALQRTADVWLLRADVPAVKKGRDTISFPWTEAGTPETFAVLELISRDDPACWRLSVGK